MRQQAYERVRADGHRMAASGFDHASSLTTLSLFPNFFFFLANVIGTCEAFIIEAL